MAHFFVIKGGSKIRDQLAHFFIDIHSLPLCKMRKESMPGSKFSEEPVRQCTRICPASSTPCTSPKVPDGGACASSIEISCTIVPFGYFYRSATICSLLGNFMASRLPSMPTFERAAACEILQ